MNRDLVLALALLSTSLLACGPFPPAVATLRAHTAKRTGCPRDEIIVTAVSPNIYRVDACGRVATYSCVRHYADRYTLGYEDECVRAE